MIFPNKKKKKKNTAKTLLGSIISNIIDSKPKVNKSQQSKDLSKYGALGTAIKNNMTGKESNVSKATSLISGNPISGLLIDTINNIKDMSKKNSNGNSDNSTLKKTNIKKEKSDSAYNKLQEYKKQKGINLFNENSKSVKEDKKYNQLLKEAQKKQIDYQTTRGNEVSSNKKYDKGILGGIEKGMDAIAGGYTRAVSGAESSTKKILGISGDDITEEKYKYNFIEKTEEQAYNQTKSSIGKAGLDVVDSIGQQLYQMMFPGGAVVSTIAGFANYGGSAYNEAKKNGATEKQATTYGIVSGTLEMTMEKVLGGFENIYGKKMGKSFIDNVINKVIKNKALKKTISEMEGEFTEEYLQEFLDPVLKNAILEEDNGADFWNTMKDDIGTGLKQLGSQFFNKENLYAGTLGAFTSGVMEAPQNISRNNWSKQTGRDFETGYTENEQKVIDNVIQERINEIEKNGKNLTKNERNKIEKEIKEDLENGQIDIETIENTLGKNQAIQNLINQTENSLGRRLTEQETQDTTKQATEKFLNEMDISKDTFLQKSYEERDNKSKEFEYTGKNTITEYSQATIDSAKGKINNTRNSKNLVDAMVKMSNDRQMAYKITNTEELKQKGLIPEGKTANGMYIIDNNGAKEILVNVNSNKYLESILVHETTHDLENDSDTYNTLKEVTKRFAEAKGDYSKIKQEVEGNYRKVNNTDIDSEVTSRLLEDYLGNKDFITGLTTEKPSIVQKIIDTIKYVKKQFTTSSKEARKLNKLQYEMEQAYKKAYNIKSSENTSKTKFSIQTDENGNKYVNVDTDQDIFEGKNLYEQNKIAKKYILDTFRESGLTIGNDNIDVTSRTANEYTHPKNTLKKMEASSKIKASTELNNLLLIAEYSHSNADDGRHLFAKDGWDYYKVNFRVGNNNFEGLINIAKNGDKKTLYDITQIKKTSLVGSDNMSTTTNVTSFSNTNISQSTENVNNDISSNNISKISENDTKYSLSNENINQKVEKALQKSSYKAINMATKTADTYLDFDYKQKKEFKNKLKQFDNMTRDELINSKTYNKIQEIVNEYANKEYNYVDEQLDSIKKQIKNTKIKVSDYLRNQITDYKYFKRDSKLKLGKDGESVDSFWQELSNTYPYLFSKDVYTEADILYELSDFMNQDITITEKYRIPDSELKYASDKIYNKLLDNSITEKDIQDMQNLLEKKSEKRTRRIVHEELINKMGITIEDIDVGQDISSIEYQRTDPVRLNEKVFGYEKGRKINEATIYFTRHQEGERTRWLNNERDEIRKLGIKARSKESELVQKYGEKKWIDENGEEHKYGDKELQKDVQDEATREKIIRASKILRNKYDSYIDQINLVLTDLGYDAIPKRQDYMRHFYEITDKFSQLGIPFNRNDMSAEDLPTDINGLTELNKPGKSWFASAQKRTGKKTVYDAITGIDGYLEGASNLIFHTESIQRYRALTRMIRENYGKERGLENVDLLSDEDLQKRIEDIQDNKLSKYVAWLDEQANSLAGKKGAIDRSVERFGRKVYTAANILKSQVGSNMTGFNVRSSLTNFASAIQGASKTNKLSFIKGTISTIKNIVHNDGLVDKSDFLTTRFGSDMLSTKLWQKVSNAGQIFMSGTDYFTSNQIWRSKYYENLSKGMNETDAIKSADDFSSRIMGDRSKGSTAEIFNSKTLGFLTQFQLEVNNQWSSLIHDNKMDIESGEKTGATVVFQLGQLFGASFLFNKLMITLTGSDVMLDPIKMLMEIFNPDDDDKTFEQRAEKVLGDLVNNLPMASIFTGGRIPIADAFSGLTTLKNKVTGKTDEFGNEIKWSDVADDFKESIGYWIMPTGYSQLKKTTKGLSMYDDKLPISGSYTKSGNLRFTADESAGGILKSALFGQYSSDEAQEYIDSGYKSINKKNIEEMKELGMKSSEYRKYRDGLSKAGTGNEEKIDYINKLNVSESLKSLMASNLLKRKVDMSTYDDYGSYEEFYYSYKNPEKYAFLQETNIEYFNYKNNKEIKDAVDWAYKTPKNYYMAQSITQGDIVKYKKYVDEINKIKSDVNSNGKTISGSRMNKVISYVNSLKLSIAQKAMLIKQEFPSFKKYDNQIVKYIDNKNLDFKTKMTMLKSMKFNNFDEQILKYVKENYKTMNEQIEELKNIGFNITYNNGKYYVKR